jgi:cytoskeletal protein CcmA (bactofilin family)
MENQKSTGNSDVCIFTAGTSIKGTLKIESNLRLEGEIKGNVSCAGKIVMSRTGIIEGDISCNELVSEGKITGNISSNKGVVLHSTAVLKGDLICSALQIDNGATFNGKCSMHKTTV